MNYTQEHSVIVSFWFGKEDWDPIYELEDELRKVIDAKGVGQFDGHEINMDNTDGCLYMYGPNAEELFKVVKPILDATDFMKGATATLRFGSYDKAAQEIDIKIC